MIHIAICKFSFPVAYVRIESHFLQNQFIPPMGLNPTTYVTSDVGKSCACKAEIINSRKKNSYLR